MWIRTTAVPEAACASVDDCYLRELDECLLAAAASGIRDFSRFARKARGAFPSLVADRLAALELDVSFAQQGGHDTRQPNPELHPLDFEWYFQPAVADEVAAVLDVRSSRVLCLGAPTVAVALARRRHEVVLIDRNPLVRPRLHPVDQGVDVRTHDLWEPIEATHDFDAVFFDAPWYPDEEELWLWQACRAVRRGGTVLFSLFPPLVRPTAKADRAAILAEASVLGDVSVMATPLTYATPLFEAEALAAIGLPAPASWRVADLVAVRDVKAIAPSPPPRPGIDLDVWDTWVIGSQVVKLRQNTSGDPHHIISPVPGTSDWRYASVSRRDAHRALVDLWTSRNRVARVGDRAKVIEILDAQQEARHSAGHVFGGRGDQVQRDMHSLLWR